MTPARLAAAAVAVLVGLAIAPVFGWLAAVIAGCWLILEWRRPDPDTSPPHGGNGAEAIKALERIATKAITPREGRRRR